MKKRFENLLAGVLLGTLALTSTPVSAGDPFEDARYFVTIDEAKVLALVDSGQVAVNDANEEGYTLLHYAADANRLSLVQALLKRGADPAARSKRGSTPYDMATQASVRLLLARPDPAASATAATNAPFLGRATASPVTSGICAAVRAEPVSDGRSPAIRPLMRARDAIWYNKPEELAALLADCVDANAKDPTGATLLHAAADRNRVDAARILLNHGANRRATDAFGKVPAAYATSAEMRGLLGSLAPSPSASQSLRIECQQKYQADVALAYDDTMKLRAQNKWSRCLKTGRYQ
jgi:hypothetical protein